ncbi:MAG: hypothetical protein OHK0046_12750 [Anaerolineae bacterium]
MSDHEHFEDDHILPPAEEPEAPASVVFMQMMRREAERYAAERTFPEEVPAVAVEPEPAPAAPVPEVTAAALEAQRIRRVERRKQRRRHQTVGVLAGLLRSVFVIIISGGLIATILSWSTSPESLDSQLRADLQQLSITVMPTLPPTLIPTPNYLKRIGIVSGHRGPENDPGAVCPDGLTENEINYAVAQRVVLRLREMGYTVDLLEEFDPRLNGYVAEALVSIHSNDCTDYGPGGTGYLVSQSASRPETGADNRLTECVASHYESITQLPRHFGVTRDMNDYHIFREINLATPGTILELGFMFADREILTSQPDLLATGVVNGILCFLQPETAPIQPTPDILATPEGGIS